MELPGDWKVINSEPIIIRTYKLTKNALLVPDILMTLSAEILNLLATRLIVSALFDGKTTK